MAVATPIPRYDKTQLLLIDGKEIKLIDHLKELREQKNITKKKISNMVKKNDYWYSQVERSGKKGDDNRQRTIYEPDLLNIISIVKYDAQTSSDLKALYAKSEIYLLKVMKATPVKASTKKLNMYDIHNNRSPKEQEQLISSLLSTHEKLLKQAFNHLETAADKDAFLNCLKNINTSLRIDPMFIVFLSGLPYADFLYETKQEDLFAFLRNIMKILDSFTNNEDISEHPTAEYYFNQLQLEITKYTDKTYRDIFTKRIKPLPIDEMTF